MSGLTMEHAVALARQGELAKAEQELRELVRLAPDVPQGHLNLGVVLAERGLLAEAEACFRKAIELEPEYSQANHNLGSALRARGRLAEASGYYRQAVAIKPDHADAMSDLGLTLTELGDAPAAVPVLQHALRLRPEIAQAWNNLGLALAGLGKFTDAEAAYEHALRLDPRSASTLTNLASCYKEQGRPGEAVSTYDLALLYEPENPSTRFNRALALLAAGRYEEGFREYEWRWRRGVTPKRNYAQPEWDGSDLAGRTLLLYAEQGLGDTVQFIRYAQCVKEQKRPARVVFECPPPLTTLLSPCPGIDELVVEGGLLPPFDSHLPMLSLPRVLGTTLDAVPAEIAYLRPDPARVNRWMQKLARMAADGEFTVGIVWQGNPHHQWDRWRSAPLAVFEPLAHVPGARLVSLQRGPGTEQITTLRSRMDRWPGRKWDLVEVLDRGQEDAEGNADLAALMSTLDLVVTVDTATAHIAGALGVPTWVLLAAVSDWRWMTSRDDSPWYPTVRLFRQRGLGDWPAVLARVAEEMTWLAARPVYPPGAPDAKTPLGRRLRSGG